MLDANLKRLTNNSAQRPHHTTLASLKFRDAVNVMPETYTVETCHPLTAAR